MKEKIKNKKDKKGMDEIKNKEKRIKKERMK